MLSRRTYARVVAPGGLPVAPMPDLLLDLAAAEPFTVLRHAIDVLEFRRQLDLATFLDLSARRPGASVLRRALVGRLPGLSRAASRLEVDFLLLLEANRLPLPQVNVHLAGMTVDMFWPDLGTVVELDGQDNHGTAHQLRRDASRDARLRDRGLNVLRLDWPAVNRGRGAAALAALAAHGVRRPSPAGPRPSAQLTQRTWARTAPVSSVQPWASA